MITATEETGTAQAATDKPKANKKASVGQKRAHVAPLRIGPDPILRFVMPTRSAAVGVGPEVD
jgi:hypothetical protein